MICFPLSQRNSRLGYSTPCESDARSGGIYLTFRRAVRAQLIRDHPSLYPASVGCASAIAWCSSKTYPPDQRHAKPVRLYRQRAVRISSRYQIAAWLLAVYASRVGRPEVFAPTPDCFVGDRDSTLQKHSLTLRGLCGKRTRSQTACAMIWNGEQSHCSWHIRSLHTRRSLLQKPERLPTRLTAFSGRFYVYT
ncbi:hypothetical protein J2Y48_004084 [Mycoplana sp. BE70]|nr:hypothetical protein [Mycoplana sp. BE70]